MAGLLSSALTVAGSAGEGGFKAAGSISSDKIKANAQKIRDENQARLNDKYAQKQEERSQANKKEMFGMGRDAALDDQQNQWEHEALQTDVANELEEKKYQRRKDESQVEYERRMGVDEITYQRRKGESQEIYEQKVEDEETKYQRRKNDSTPEGYGKTWARVFTALSNDVGFVGDKYAKADDITDRIHGYKREDRGGDGGGGNNDLQNSILAAKQAEIEKPGAFEKARAKAVKTLELDEIVKDIDDLTSESPAVTTGMLASDNRTDKDPVKPDINPGDANFFDAKLIGTIPALDGLRVGLDKKTQKFVVGDGNSWREPTEAEQAEVDKFLRDKSNAGSMVEGATNIAKTAGDFIRKNKGKAGTMAGLLGSGK